MAFGGFTVINVAPSMPSIIAIIGANGVGKTSTAMALPNSVCFSFEALQACAPYINKEINAVAVPCRIKDEESEKDRKISFQELCSGLKEYFGSNQSHDFVIFDSLAEMIDIIDSYGIDKYTSMHGEPPKYNKDKISAQIMGWTAFVSLLESIRTDHQKTVIILMHPSISKKPTLKNLESIDRITAISGGDDRIENILLNAIDHVGVMERDRDVDKTGGQIDKGVFITFEATPHAATKSRGREGKVLGTHMLGDPSDFINVLKNLPFEGKRLNEDKYNV